MSLLNAEYSSKTRTIGLVVIITVAAFGLRFARLSNQSLWIDEVSSVLTAQVPMNRIAAESALDSCLPTYFLILRGVLGGATTDVEFRARVPSVIAGALSIPVFIGVVYFWRRKWSPALLAGLLLAVSPLHLWYSQEARAYGLTLFFGLLAFLCYELARCRHRPIWGVGYVLCSLVAIALHKTALLFPLTCALWQCFDILRPHLTNSSVLHSLARERAKLRPLLIHAFLFIIAFLFLMPKSKVPPEEVRRPGSVLEIGYTFMTYVGGYSFGPSPADIQSYGASGALLRHPGQAAILGAILVLIGAAFARVFLLRRKAREALGFPGKELSLLALTLGAIALGALLSGFPYNIRYTLPGLAGFLAFAAAVLAGPVRSAFNRIVIACLVAVSLWADGQWFFDPAYRRGDARAVALWLVQNQGSVKSWTVLPNYLSHGLKWYLKSHPEIAARLLSAERGNTTSFPPVPDVLIISRRHHILSPDLIISSYKEAAGKTRTITSFAGFELYVRDAAQ